MAARALPTVVCAGATSFEVGRAHGVALRSEILSALRILAADRTARGLAVSTFLAETGHLDAMRHHTPDLIDEIRGIAEGAEAAFEEVAALSLMDEEWTWARRGDTGAPGCTVVGIPARVGAAAVLGQTMDLPTVHDGSQAVLELRFAAETLRCWIVTMAGQIGLMGVNSSGLGVVVNNLSTLPTAAHGLPVAAVLRGLLGRCNNVAAAGTFLSAVPHATGQAYTVGDASGCVRCWEADALGVEEATGTLAAAPGGVLVHANHPVVRVPDAALWSTEGAAALYARTRSYERRAAALDSLSSFAASSSAPAAAASPAAAAVGAVEDALCRPPVCVDAAAGAARRVFTFAACVFELTAPPRVLVASGPPAAAADFVSVSR